MTASSLRRRDFLTLGTVALTTLGMSRPVAAARPAPGFGRARACLLIYLDGGPSHIDLWDLKPDAPAEVRGEFNPVSTSVPGLTVCEHLPLTARQMHLLAQVRSVRHAEAVHDPAVYQMLTGRKHVSSAGGLTVQPDDFPHVGCALGQLDRRPAAMPPVIELPETMRMDARVLPGQNAGFLGVAHDPFRVEVDRDAGVVPPEFSPHPDAPPPRLADRAGLLARLDREAAALAGRDEVGELERLRQQALDLLDRPQVREAFDLDREPSAVRDWYGRHRHGQSVLLGRRLIEAGARFVTVYWGKEMQDWADGKGPRPANNPWDTHRNHFLLLRDDLLPRADRALAAVVADLDQRGLLETTLVVWMGDFGRTPRIDRKWASRDHWPHANTVLFAGAGVPGGAVVGRTDRHAAEVVDDPVSPADLTATVCHLLGVNPASTLRDRAGRTHVLSDGRPVSALLG